MGYTISDEKIKKLIDDVKPITHKVTRNIQFKNRSDRKHQMWEHTLRSKSGNVFHIKIRQNIVNKLDFSVILMYEDYDKTLYILKRYNGKHTHKNQIEKNKFRDFHIHTATERYQEKGYDIEGYAEVTNEFSDWRGAINKMLKDCNFELNTLDEYL